MIADLIYDLLPEDLPKYVGELPGGAVNAVAIIEYDGYTNTEYFGTGTVFQPIIKIVVRNNSYSEGQQWCDAIKAVLHRHKDDTLLSVLLVNSFMYLGRGETKLHEFQGVFKTIIKE